MLVIVKGKHDVANTHLASMFKRRSAFDHLLVQERAIAAVEIFDAITHAIADDFAVIPADRANVDDNIALGMPTEDRFGSVKFVPPTGLGTIVRCEKGHPASILSVKGLAASSRKPPKGMLTRRF